MVSPLAKVRIENLREAAAESPGRTCFLNASMVSRDELWSNGKNPLEERTQHSEARVAIASIASEAAESPPEPQKFQGQLPPSGERVLWAGPGFPFSVSESLGSKDFWGDSEGLLEGPRLPSKRPGAEAELQHFRHEISEL